MPALKVLFLSTPLFLSACLFESAEQKVTRAQQFNGKTLAQVSSLIGPPTQQSANSAIWHFDKTVEITETRFENFQRGKSRLIGDVTETTHFNCTYTATLDQGRIASSQYDGNSCRRFSPTVHSR
ncbi:hypothetical protein F9L33_02745 [Amylibacter sp. SFDW26]|uniref:hypothetical protein n=1 Tax=Amylibacter sp. SFDW26 TaxID=2652722 RepID=UPI001261C4B7|nr:hypothetical protein [Amylibacter sp. SFDW26]KAB7615698.1 hypothetical protein F9L33_02745 [Amylibacter sp. SFDW26]